MQATVLLTSLGRQEQFRRRSDVRFNGECGLLHFGIDQHTAPYAGWIGWPKLSR